MRLLTLMSIFIMSNFIIPFAAFAHGTEDEHQQEVAANLFVNYSLIGSAVFLLIGVILLFLFSRALKSVNVKKQQGREERDKLRKWLRVSQWVTVLSLLLLITVGVYSLMNSETGEGAVEFLHIHGLGITNDGTEIFVPAHDGLKVFEDGVWTNAPGEAHDYMGFSMVDDGFYSSGHPGDGSTLKNPFGVIRSIDMGETFEMLDLYGEVDFHGMAVGYNSHAIYVMNPQPNSRMDETGLYYSVNETKKWTKSDAAGLEGEAAAFAVHPTQEGTVVIATSTGVFVSNDYGQTFNTILDTPATAVSFSQAGELFAGTYLNGAGIVKINIGTGDETIFALPEINAEDAISYVAVNPQDQNQVVFSTFEKDIFLTNDEGEEWEQIADKGIGISVEVANNTSKANQ